jgi:hypothetical protein
MSRFIPEILVKLRGVNPEIVIKINKAQGLEFNPVSTENEYSVGRIRICHMISSNIF